MQFKNSLILLLISCAVCIPVKMAAQLKIMPAKKNKTAILWKPAAGYQVRILPVVITSGGNPVTLQEEKVTVHSADSITLSCKIRVNQRGKTITGTYLLHVAYLQSGGTAEFLRQHSTLQFKEAVHTNLSVENIFEVSGEKATAMLAEQMELTGGPAEGTPPNTTIYTYGMKAHSLLANARPAAFFEMGYQSTDSVGSRLSMPVVGFAFPSAGGKNIHLSVSSDPYAGTQFYGQSLEPGGKKTTRIRMVSNYCGEVVPLLSEARTAVLAYSHSGTDGIIRSFYNTIPEIAPAPSWVHEVALAYYDYNSEDGKGWYRDMDAMAAKCPPEHRSKIAVCLHGWYDNTGYYCYDHSTGTLKDEWMAFANPAPGYNSKHPIQMSKTEMHQRISYARNKGFRVILYFADGTNCTGTPDFHKGEQFRYKDGSYKGGWTGPCGGGPALDPASRSVQEWYLDYLEALLQEYGKEIDGLVFDETNYFLADDVSYRIPSAPAYADREMMKWMALLKQKVQQWRTINPDLVFLEGSHYFYGLVADGSFTDFSGLPSMINYRNSSWTCSWQNPGVRNWHTTDRTRKDIKYPYGLDMGLSNGWGSDTGPSEMDAKTLDETFRYFIQRVKQGPEPVKIKFIEGQDMSLKP